MSTGVKMRKRQLANGNIGRKTREEIEMRESKIPCRGVTKDLCWRY